MPNTDGVCVVTHPLSAAGENATRGLLDILSDITTVSLVTADLPDDSVIRENYQFVEISTKGMGENIFVDGFRFLTNQLSMCREILRCEKEIILFFGATSYLLPVFFARMIGKTVVVQPRGDVPLTLRLRWGDKLPSILAWLLAGSVRLLERISFNLADAIITYTPQMASELDLNKFEDKLHTDGARYVNTEVFSISTPFEDRDECVGYLGRIDKEKGIKDMAEVVEKLPDRIKFIFIGEGNLTDWLRNELTEEIEDGEVEVTGWIEHDRVPEQLNRLKLLMLPSRATEGLPTVILESLACGTPVIASPVSGIPDIVREGETGYLIEDEEPEELAREIKSILDSNELQELSERGRQLIINEYSFEAAVKRYQNILQEIRDTP